MLNDLDPTSLGGLLDRCAASQPTEVYVKNVTQTSFAEVDVLPGLRYKGITYLGDVSNITLDSIASLPVRVCFCNRENQPDCSYQPPSFRVKKGETFIVSLVSLDQASHLISGHVNSSLAFLNGGFAAGQQSQKVSTNCTDLKFNVFSPADSKKMTLYADGPCGSAAPSTIHVEIHFSNCTCSIGFEPSNTNPAICECICDSALSSYITNCNYTTDSLQRDSNAWITYINDTDPPGYVIHPYCPFDYCHSQIEKINFSLPAGVDAQCAYNHTGVLCGACHQNLRLSLGNSRCLPCYDHWPAVFVAILLATIIAGILLVVALLVLNMTVAVGFINGIIFFADIVAASGSVLFPNTEPTFPTVLVAWLNLDIGFNVCFINGLDAYTKTWLQLAFPAYIILLVVLVIKISEYSPRFTRLIGPGKRDTVATLATLVLLSYAKLLSATIAVLSFAVLDYPNGSQETVWLSNGNVKYFHGKHIVLAVTALLIVLIGIPYTFLLFLGNGSFNYPVISSIIGQKILNSMQSLQLTILPTTISIAIGQGCFY